MGLATFWAIFFANSSGHPGPVAINSRKIYFCSGYRDRYYNDDFCQFFIHMYVHTFWPKIGIFNKKPKFEISNTFARIFDAEML
jgi:hypothetical protein